MSHATVVGRGALAEAVADRLRREGLLYHYPSPRDVRDTDGPCGGYAWINCVGSEEPARRAELIDWGAAVGERVQVLAALCGRARVSFGRQGGAIVNVVGTSSAFALPSRGADSVAEAASAMLTRCLGVAWACERIRVNAVAFDAQAEARAPRYPLARAVTVSEVAEAVAFLAGPDASYVTGEILRVDGGWGAYHLY